MGDWKKVENPVVAPEQAGPPPAEKRTAEPAVPPAEPAEERIPPVESPAAGDAAAGEGNTALAVAEEKEKESGPEWSKTGEPEDSEQTQAVIRASGRYTRRGRRRGRHRFAAPLGLLVLLLAATGVVALVIFGVQAIQKSQDDTALREELMDFLNPVIQFIPDPFEDVNDDPQDSLMLAAIWKLTDAERIRQIREKDDESIYPIDDEGFMLIPLKTVTDSYASLYGKDAVPQLKSIGEPDTFM